ncbi:unnamed protein product [Phytomonas sp. EM1]|nr:unnamed protein product [Phytomonas sp. EM1]|eukprot:CCW59788.1 unnamed protein product [Phytomonas sp. isolate EM1]
MVRRFKEFQTPPDDDLARCMDRSAAYLAHGQARDLPVAAELWLALHRQHEGAAATPEMARIARECGRLLHFLRRPLAKEVLETAHAYSVEAHGGRSVERALVMGCLAPYLDPTEGSIREIEECIAILEENLSSMEVVLSKEEMKMLLETVFVLTMCKSQILKEMGKETLESIWNSLEDVEARLKQLK